MELEPYKALVTGIVVQELRDCGWVELISIPIENPEKAKPEDIQNAIEAIHNMLYKADKVELSVQGVQLCLHGLSDHRGTYRVCASADVHSGPTFVA